MKLKQNITLRKTCGINVLTIPQGKNIQMVKLNETACLIWEQFAQVPSFEQKDLVDFVVKEFEVSNDVAAKDVNALLSQWHKAGLLEE